MGINLINEKKILVLKNDRAGDLFTSLKLISTLIRDSKRIKIYLSEFNFSFNFFFKEIKIKKINYNLNLFDKLKIIKEIFQNKYSDIYILSPKNFYFFLPLIFRNIRFYAIVYEGKKRNRPNNFLKKFLHKYQTVNRYKLNEFSYKQLQEKLIDNNAILDNDYSNLHLPKINKKILDLVPKNYIFFQFRYKFFEKLNWDTNKIEIFINFLKKRYENVLFCSDIEKNNKSFFYNNFFEKNFSIIDLNNNIKKINTKNNNIFFLKELSGEDMFFIIKMSQMAIAKEGLVSHISFFHNVKCHNLFNFKINSKEDILHEKISYSEWCKGMKFTFSFLNKNIEKSIKKIEKFI